MIHAKPRGRARRGPKAHQKEQGFTLTELLVVIVITSILVGIAVVGLSPGQIADSASGFADEIAALCDSARTRASATRQWQRLEVQDDRVIHWESTSEGMAAPTSWVQVAELYAPSAVFVGAVDNRAHLAPDDGVPGEGVGLGDTIDFAPDGGAEPATIFIGSQAGTDRDRVRVVIYRATGTPHVFAGW